VTSGDRLAQHYAMKYAGSADTLTAPEPIGITRFPVGRLAAAVKYLPTLAAGKDVLEIGAGDGVIPESLKAAGCDFKSYTLGDLSEVRFAALRRTLDDPRYKFAVVDGDNPRASLATEQFDVVITLDVIEHLIDPITAMVSCCDLVASCT
jgi:2-polyprenyl-3-methyl-5-hydroxy-6-metoxy-1,4-benzoquinol methylase